MHYTLKEFPTKAQKRKPKMRREVFVHDLFLYAYFSPIALAAIWVALPLFVFPNVTGTWYWVALAAGIILTYVFLKRLAIGCVLCYKAFAPMEVRQRCRFTPTCSTYMIMAINKYGLFIGMIKGFRRIRRCRPPNGGVDYP